MECLKPIYLHKQDMVVPCGRCAFCAVTRRSDWSTRLNYEAKKHLVKKFVTLTYANAHLSWAHNNPQLVKSHLQDWFREIRRDGNKVRYFAVGEYGSKTFRPHYHVILFGDVSDSHIRDCWKKGQVHIGTVTQASIMYCLGYIVNKTPMHLHHREKPFTLMSLRPGLGANYLSPEMIRWHKGHSFLDHKNYVLVDGMKCHLPRYYKTKIFSKLDLVRIAVRDQKALFKKMVEWVRSPEMMKHKDPLKYREEQKKRLAMKIRLSSKENLTI